MGRSKRFGSSFVARSKKSGKHFLYPLVRYHYAIRNLLIFADYYITIEPHLRQLHQPFSTN